MSDRVSSLSGAAILASLSLAILAAGPALSRESPEQQLRSGLSSNEAQRTGAGRPKAGQEATPARGARPAAPDGLVQPGARFERVARGLQFAEGPAPDQEGGLWFTDVFMSRLYHWSPDGRVSLYRSDTNRLNGLYFDHQGQLLGCEWYGRRVIRDDLQGGVSVVTDSYEGKKLNGPNDIWVAPDGGIYFTDPSFGDVGELEQDGNYVYYVAPGADSPQRVTGKLVLPNGVIGTPEGDLLYVTDSGGPTWRYDVQADGSLGNPKLFAAQGGDGMTLDELGNVYLAYQYDVLVYDPKGETVERLRPPEPPANVAFGGAEGSTLFITAQSSVYSLAMAVRGALAPEVLPSPTPQVPPTPEPSALYFPECHRQ